jgi:hypothetical protein
MSKVKVLFLAANPATTSRLALDEEIRAIDGKIQGAAYRDNLDLLSHWAVRLDDLSGLLMRHQPHVVHFSGHGAADVNLVVHRDSSAPRELIPDPAQGAPASPGAAAPRQGQVPVEGLARLLGVLKDNVRVVVLNACYSEAQAHAIVQSIDCAVGTSGPIRDDHAIAFAAEFYQALAYGRSVRDAFQLGVVRLQNQGYAQAEKLVRMHTREGVDAATVVLVTPPTAARTAAPAQPVPDRMALVRNLGRLAPADWALLVSAIEGAESRISHHGTVPEQVAELLRWAGSPTGPGLAAISEAYRQLQNP